MRLIGTLPDERRARRFSDYLLTLGIEVNVDEDDAGWAVWVYDEDQVDEAKRELAEFAENPNDARYAHAQRVASERRQAAAKKQKQAKKNFVDVRQRWERPFTSRCPVTVSMLIITGLIGFTMQVGNDNSRLISELSITSYERTGNVIRYRPGLPEVKGGQVWRLVTPIFLHFGWLHLLFNLYMFMLFSSAVETLRGSSRILLLVLLLAVLSNWAQYGFGGNDFEGAPNFGGLSGVVYGLFGYVWMKGKFDPRSGFFLDQRTVVILIGWFFLCWMGLIGSIANMAHTVGLVAGMLIGRLSALSQTTFTR